MLQRSCSIFVLLAFCFSGFSQSDSTTSGWPTITGSVDAYYRYNFANAKDAEGNPVTNVQQAIELISTKIGTVLLILGLMHFFNIFLFNRARKAARHPKTPAEQAYYTQRFAPQQAEPQTNTQ